MSIDRAAAYSPHHSVIPKEQVMAFKAPYRRAICLATPSHPLYTISPIVHHLTHFTLSICLTTPSHPFYTISPILPYPFVWLHHLTHLSGYIISPILHHLTHLSGYTISPILHHPTHLSGYIISPICLATPSHSFVWLHHLTHLSGGKRQVVRKAGKMDAETKTFLC